MDTPVNWKGERSTLLPFCRRRHVVAVLVSPDGTVHVGSNGITRPLNACPRNVAHLDRGVGWSLCQEVCGQPRHAEVDALVRAGPSARGATLYLIGHDRSCAACLAAMARAGVRELVVASGTAVAVQEIAGEVQRNDGID